MNRLAAEEMVPVSGYQETTLPGIIEYRNTKEYKRDGIPIGIQDLNRLQECGNNLGVELPWKI
jgi:LDH2 family malate/lactate/ureidoglycolate dehydrogenase